MIKQQVILEVKRDERIYQLHLPANSPLGEVHDILFQMRSYIVEQINESLKIDQPKENQKTSQEESKIEEIS